MKVTISEPDSPDPAAGPLVTTLTDGQWLQRAFDNHDRGWHPVPVGRIADGEKVPTYKTLWLAGVTGYDGAFTDTNGFGDLLQQVEELQARGTKGILSLGVRMPKGVIGIDVDAYGEKRGADQLRELEGRLGTLPPAPVVTARRYDCGSGIRLFRVPTEWRGKTNPTEHIELIQWFHRYLVAPPSYHHSGKRYRVYDESGTVIADGVLPATRDLPELPAPWVQGLRDITARAGGGETSPEQVRAFEARYDGGPQPEAVQWGPIKKHFAKPPASVRNATRDALCWAAREAKGGRYGFGAAAQAVRAAAESAYAARGDHLDGQDFERMVGYAVTSAESLTEKQCRDRWEDPSFHQAQEDWLFGRSEDGRSDSGEEVDVAPWERYPLITAKSLAEPTEPMRWLVTGVWAEKSAGVTAGHKKTFKSWMMHSRALAIASGLPYLDHFDVPRAGPVLFICGEGGQDAFINRHQVIADRYGIARQDLKDLVFGAVTRMSHLDDSTFMAAIDHHLDTVQPVAVFIDPLYAVHPPNVDSKMLYERGQMLARLRDRVERYAALDVGDHFNKTAPPRGLDLDHIGYVGMSQWADSWSLQCHRSPYSRNDNRAQLDVEFGSRRSGARLYQIDWKLERDLSDPMVIAWHNCDWSVSTSAAPASVPRIETYMQRARLILQQVDDEPSKATKDDVVKYLTEKYKGGGSTRAQWRDTWDVLLTDGILLKTDIDGWRNYQGSMRRAKLTVYKRGGEPVEHPELDA